MTVERVAASGPGERVSGGTLAAVDDRIDRLMTVGAIIVAGGRGVRLGADVPKQLLEIDGRSILRRAVDAFDRHPRIEQLVVVLPADLVGDAARSSARRRGPAGSPRAAPARQDSVRLGLAAMPAGPGRRARARCGAAVRHVGRPDRPRDCRRRTAGARGSGAPRGRDRETRRSRGRRRARDDCPR